MDADFLELILRSHGDGLEAALVLIREAGARQHQQQLDLRHPTCVAEASTWLDAEGEARGIPPERRIFRDKRLFATPPSSLA